MNRILFFLALATALSAAPLFDEPVAELKLKDARVFHDARALSFNSSTVLLRHSGGAASIPYAAFPAEYQDGLAVRRPAQKTKEQLDAEVALATQKADLEHIANMERKKAMEEQAAKNARHPEVAELKNSPAIEALANKKARDYFLHHWTPGNSSTLPTRVDITLDIIEPKPGWPGQWDITGEAYVGYYISSGDSFSSQNIKFTADLIEKGGPDSFKVTLVN